MRFRVGYVCLLALALLVGGCGSRLRPAGGEVTPVDGSWPKITLEKVAGGLARPLFLTHAGDDPLYVLEQAGRIRIIEKGRVLAEPFLDLTDRVNSKGMEQGLLGLAFHPQYGQNGLFFVHYTGREGQTVISRFRRQAANAVRADAGSEEVVLTVPQPFANHNGGPILFGPDGYLYIALGDGGSAGDPGNRAQNLESLLGKILRLEVSESGAYRIPESNPFVGKPGRGEIWAYGLRNPWRISFDRQTGDLYIADVGQNEIEEVNFQPAGSRGGENYGWKLFEGVKRYSGGEAPGAVAPVAQYTHKEGGCSITGGFVYRGSAIGALAGIYLYADYCSGKIWGLRRTADGWASQELLKVEASITSFGEDRQGELYVVDQRGTIYRVRAGK